VCDKAKKLFLPTDKKSYLILLFLGSLFLYYYFPQALIVNEDISLVHAMEVDAGSIMESILGLYETPYYSMFNSYHSKYYGWSYFVITFVLLTPIKIISYLFFNSNPQIDFTSIRLIFLLIGICTIYFSYLLFDKITKGNERVLVVLLCLAIIFPPVTNLYYKLHPETTGILFVTLSLIMLMNYIQDIKFKNYTYSVIFLATASSAKQIFFFASLPILFLYYKLFSTEQKLPYIKYLKSKNFYLLSKNTILIAALIFFLFNPYVLVNLPEFIARQGSLLIGFQGENVSTVESLFKWMDIIDNDPIYLISLLLCPLNLFYSWIFLLKKSKSKYTYLNIFNCINILILFLCLLKGNQFAYSSHYLIPLNIFLYLNILAISIYFFSNKNKYIVTSARLFVYSIFAISIYSNFNVIQSQLDSRLDYLNLTPYKTYSYIKNLTLNNKNLKITHDHHVALPSTLKNGCHFWNKCSGNNIYNFEPDYIFFDSTWTYMGKPHEATDILNIYVKENNMILIDKIDNISIYKSNVMTDTK